MNIRANHGTYCGNNARYFSIGRVTVYFSYDTLVAFELDGVKYVCENHWSPTTAKHLHNIQAKEKHIHWKEWERLVDEKLGPIFDYKRVA